MPNPVNIIGVMSGSSLDGLDMALCRFQGEPGSVSWEMSEAQTLPFPDHLYKELSQASTLSGFDLMKLDAAFGKWIGLVVRQWMKDYSIQAGSIASHGHTVFHEPASGFTTQIGSGAHIAFASGLQTVTTFRAADVAAGGQGAPFAPIADTILFPGYEGYLNLGGIANINLLTVHGEWKAWDIGPCNQALNFLAQKTGHAFDVNGHLASTGEIIPDVVEKLLSFYPYREGQPKGLSNAEVKSTWLMYLDSSKEGLIDLLASVSEAIAIMLMQHIRPKLPIQGRVLVTGGGVHNTGLMERINVLAQQHGLIMDIPRAKVADYKECLLMAYLGYLTLQRQSYGIKNITGASMDTIGGAIFWSTR